MVISCQLSVVGSLLAKLKTEETEESMDMLLSLVDQLNTELAAAAVVLPLYQVVRTFYYPKHIKNLVVGRSFLEYPEIAALRL